MAAGHIFFPPKTNSSTFTTSGTFTVPAGVFNVTMIGGGGGGGGGGGSNSPDAGGQGGCGVNPSTFTIQVTPGEVLNVTIGAGGSGGAFSVDGTNGSPTTISRTSLGAVVFPGGLAGVNGGKVAISTLNYGVTYGSFTSADGNYLVPATATRGGNTDDPELAAPSITSTGGVQGGTNSDGGGGGAGFGFGGNGAIFTSTAAGAGSTSAGGGGGHKDGGANSVGANGGNGAVIFTW